MAAALSLAAGALAWPALAAVPYLLLVLRGAWRWSGGRARRGAGPRACHLLQLYLSAPHNIHEHNFHMKPIKL